MARREEVIVDYKDPDLLKGKDCEEEEEEFWVPPYYIEHGVWDDLEVDP